MKFVFYLFSFIIFLFSGCSDSTKPNIEKPDTDIKKSVSVDVGVKFQVLEGFGASDCWTGNYIGRDWDVNQRESIARLLFSDNVKNGKPEGIGLSMWRFNLGAGTANQGDDSGIEDKSRRAESFLANDGTYDWNQHKGQQYFLEKAYDYGCRSFVLFSNSPLVQYTYNGKGFSSRGAYSNLKAEHYGDFASYMADVAEHFQNNKQIKFSYISPVNEPQYNWDGGQEGSGWQNSEIKKLVIELDNAISKKNLDTKIIIPESGDYEYLYKSKDGTARSNQIVEFFSPNSDNYIGELSSVAPIIAGHSYWTDGNWDKMKEVRSQLATAASNMGLKVFQTEWSMLGDHFNDKDYPGHDSAAPLDIALHMSKVIYHDLVTANVSSWSFWTSMDIARWGHKNRFLLIDLMPGDGIYGDISVSGTHEATKSLWVLGNYSLFIRPEYQRVELNIANPSNSFFGTAWLSPDNKRLVVVYTNMTSKSIKTDLNIDGLGKYSTVKQYTTSSSKNLQESIVSDNDLVVVPRSVTTYVYEF